MTMVAPLLCWYTCNMDAQEALDRILICTPAAETIGDIFQSYIYTGSMELVVTWSRNEAGNTEVIDIGS